MDENHSIRSLHASRHLFRGLTDFLLRDCGWDSDGDGVGDEDDNPTPNTAGHLHIGSAVPLALLMGTVLSVILSKIV